MLADDVDFLELLWREWSAEADRHGVVHRPGDQACWGGIMVCAETDAQAQEWYGEMAWLWEQWMMPFGQGFPELLVGSPDTLNRRIAEVGA